MSQHDLKSSNLLYIFEQINNVDQNKNFEWLA